MKFLECVFHAGWDLGLVGKFPREKLLRLHASRGKWSEKSISRRTREGVEFSSFYSGSIIVINMFNMRKPQRERENKGNCCIFPLESELAEGYTLEKSMWVNYTFMI